MSSRPATTEDFLSVIMQHAKGFIKDRASSGHVPNHATVMAYLLDPKRAWAPASLMAMHRPSIAAIVTAELEPGTE